MKTKFKKIFSVTLAGLIIAGSISTAVFATSNVIADENSNKTETVNLSNETETETEKSLVKDETVYVLASADGSVEKIIVSDWIKNSLGTKAVSDKSNLENIENLKGDETYTLNSDNMKVWDTDGNDIYYQGNISKELPVDLSVSYTLDGKSISPKDIVGKSGKVTIRFDYKNNQYETVQIDGENKKIYVPFAMVTGLILDNDIFGNVEISNGKLLNDGDRTFVVGLALPGMQSNLDIDAQKFEIPDYIEITADVKNFELSNTVTLAVNNIFSNLDTENLNSLDDLTSYADQLANVVGRLTDGSSKLYDGICTLLEKSDDLIIGVNKLANGAGELKSGTKELCDGTKELADGLGTLTSNNETLNAGSKQVFETLLSTAEKQLLSAGVNVPTLTIENYSQVLDGVLSQLDAENVEKQVFKKIGMTKQQYETATKAGMISPEIKAMVDSTLTQAKTGYDSVSVLKKQLDSYKEFYQGLLTYTDGVSAAKTGADKLQSGSTKLNEGVCELYDGILELKDGTPALVSGIVELKEGSFELSDGLKQFNEKGVQKLVDAVDGDLNRLLTGIKASADVSKDYKSFSGISDSMNGQVKFIYRTDSIK